MNILRTWRWKHTWHKYRKLTQSLFQTCSSDWRHTVGTLTVCSIMAQTHSMLLCVHTISPDGSWPVSLGLLAGTWWGGSACDDWREPRTNQRTTGPPWSSATHTIGYKCVSQTKPSEIKLGPTLMFLYDLFCFSVVISYLPGIDPRHRLQPRQISWSVDQLQRSWQRGRERHYELAEKGWIYI